MELRRVTTNEGKLLEKLLSEPFAGRDGVQQQIENALVRQIDGNGSLSFEVQPELVADTTFRIPVEGEFQDIDGGTIHVLLHVVDGRVNELEIYKEDGSSVIKMPEAEKLRIFVPRDK